VSVKIFNGKNFTSLSTNGGQYDGEKMPGDLSSWNVLDTDSNAFLYNTYELLAARSQTLYHTYPLVRGAVNRQVDYAIGSGLAFRSQPVWSLIPNMTKEDAKDWGKEFQQYVNYYFEMFDFYDKQPLLFRGAQTQGDSLLFIEKKNGIITDLIPSLGSQINGSYNQDMYTLGIKHDSMLRANGIIKKDDTELSFYDKDGNLDLIQYFQAELPSQLRGYPLAYSMVNLAKNDDRHWDSITQRVVLESILLGTSETETTDLAKQTGNLAEQNKVQKTGIAQSVLSTIGNARKLAAGAMLSLRKGESMKFTDLKSPGNNFGMFKDNIGLYAGAAMGTPSQMIFSKYETSYTSHKGTFNDFQKTYMNKRISFTRKVMRPTIQEFLKDMVLQGYIKAPGIFKNPMILNAYTAGNYLGPIPGVINPVQEAKSNEQNIKNAIVQRGDIAAQHGNEWGNHITEWGEQEEEWTKQSPQERTKVIIEQEKNRPKDETA